MTWKYVDGEWCRLCRNCAGTGTEKLFRNGGCACPWSERMHVIDHPENDNSEIGHRLYRCDDCGSVWRVYHDTTDDSIDLPAPEYVGREIPMMPVDEKENT
jgi:hypothetical protein